jgi:hypothetical protein
MENFASKKIICPGKRERVVAMKQGTVIEGPTCQKGTSKITFDSL